jgi:hypothetical protein
MAPIRVWRRLEREVVVKIRRADFWMDDWFAGTIGLTHFERSVYITICASNWSHGRPALKDDIRNLSPGRGFDQGWDGLERKGKIVVVVDTNSTRDLHFAYNPRALDEHEKAMKRLRRSHEAGAKGGRPKSVSNGLDKPNGFDTENPRARVLQQPSPSPTIEKNQDGRGREPPAVSSLEEKFERFWSQYPSRKPHQNPRRAACEKFKTKLRGGADPDEIIQGVELFARQCEAAATDPKFIPTAVVWLNRDGWKDASEAGEPDIPVEQLEPWQREAEAHEATCRWWRKKFSEFGDNIPVTSSIEDCPPEILSERGITPEQVEEHERRRADYLCRPNPEREPPRPPPPLAEADEPEFGF